MNTPRKKLASPFYQQLQALQDGSISDEAMQALSETLASDPDARQRYYDAVDIDLGLAEIAAGLSHKFASPARRRSPWSRVTSLLRYGAVAAAALMLGMALDRLVFNRKLESPAPNSQHITANVSSSQYFATLVRSTDCEWEDVHSPFFEGKRLLTSELNLKKGVAEFRFDTGVRLVIEGPTRLRIQSQQTASLDFGKVVLHGHELAEGFQLVTPQATLTDVGTEYGAQVNENQEVELHVFQGSVLIESATSPESKDFVEAGNARRLESESQEIVPIRPELFQREVPGNLTSTQISPDGIQAYEGFYGEPVRNKKWDWKTGGVGWKGTWHHVADSFVPSKATLDPGASLEFPQHRNPARDGLIRLSPTKNIARRELQHPIRLNSSGITYLSFYLQRDRMLSPNISQYGSLSLRSSFPSHAKSRILCGMNTDGFPMLIHNDQQIPVAPPLAMGEPYFFVTKIVANDTAPDQIMMRVFLKNEEIPEQEPLVWTNVTSPAYDDTEFDRVLLYCEGVEYDFDEIRITSSWELATRFDLKLPLSSKHERGGNPETAPVPLSIKNQPLSARE